MAVDNNQYYGQTDPSSSQGDWNQLRFEIQQQMLLLNTSMPVQVVRVSGGGVAPVGFVDIKILVTQVTGNDMTVDHGVITNVPYMRLQGGTNAIIIDPQVGDIGMACFCSRDISAVKNARKQAPPGSRRAYDFSDAMYVGGFLNQTPLQYIHFTGEGIVVYSPTAITQTAPDITFNATNIVMNTTNYTLNATNTNATGGFNLTGNLATTGTMTNNGKNVGSTHTHGGVQTGGGTTGVPT